MPEDFFMEGPSEKASGGVTQEPAGMPGRMGEDGVRSLPEHLKEAENRQAASVSGAACRVVMD